MLKLAFLMGMMLSFESIASSCNVQNIEGVIELLNQAPLEKQYKEAHTQLANLRYEDSIRKIRPEVSAGIDIDKDNSSNKEITAAIMFNVTDYAKQGLLKKISDSERNLMRSDFEKDYKGRLSEVALSLFKVSQNYFFKDRLNGLIETLNSSESVYKSRPIRSRDEEIILSSLSLLKSNLLLKRSRIEDQIFEDQLNLKKWAGIDCSVDYKTLTTIVKNLKLENFNDENLITLKDLKIKNELVQNSTEYDAIRTFNNFKIGPSFSRERIDSINEYRFGVAVSFDLPSFSNANGEYVEQARKISALESERGNRDALFNKEILIQRFTKNSQALQLMPTFEKLDQDIKRIKKSFETGSISPLTYLEAYRSHVDFLETAEELRASVFESYFKLRGLYVENNNI